MKKTLFGISLIFLLFLQFRELQAQEIGIGSITMCVKADPERDIFIGEGQKVFEHSNIDYYFLTYNLADWKIEKFVEERINLATGERTHEVWKCHGNSPGISTSGNFTPGLWEIRFYSENGKFLGKSEQFEVKY